MLSKIVKWIIYSFEVQPSVCVYVCIFVCVSRLSSYYSTALIHKSWYESIALVSCLYDVCHILGPNFATIINGNIALGQYDPSAMNERVYSCIVSHTKLCGKQYNSLLKS